MLKDNSFQAKKAILVVLHIVFLILAMAGIGIAYMNSPLESDIKDILSERFEDSAEFQEAFQEDLDEIFRYVSFRDVFETDGSLDLSKEMFSVSRNGSLDIVYTLDEVLRYARSQGFYLNDKFDLVNDLFLFDNASTANDQLGNWRAYPTEHEITEPGDAYTSLLELAKEVLTCLSSYYKVTYYFIDNPSNYYFQISYYDEDEETISYTNCADRTPEDLIAMGRYCYFSNETDVVESNLPQTPTGISIAMENNNYYDAPDYYVAAAVDTSFPIHDSYAVMSEEYNRNRELLRDSLIVLAIGIAGCLITLIFMIRYSGYSSSDRSVPVIYSFDTITTESCIVLTAIFTYFMLFVGEKIGYRLIHLIFSERNWYFAETICQAMIVYTCVMICFFSLLRRYKAGQLWQNSFLRRLRDGLSDYFADRTFAYRLLCRFAAFVALQFTGIGIIALILAFGRSGTAKFIISAVIFLALVLIDYLVYRTLFLESCQEDQIADAIKEIADGDTSYQMDLDGLSGKELRIGGEINEIGTGLEKALQEQVKSERLRSDLITNVSHDIRTPLTSIINYIDLIRRENIPNERLQNYLVVLDQKSQRLKTLTEDLLEASKASSGNMKMDMTRIDLVEMIWQCNGEFEDRFEEKSLTICASLPDCSLMIMADGRHLWRVLENLYNNACKYAMEKTRVYVEVFKEEEQAVFNIKNVSEHPLNISSDELMERFVRGDESRTTEGSGLGLSIAESLTKLQGGTFDIIIDADLFTVRIAFPLADSKPSE